MFYEGPGTLTPVAVIYLSEELQKGRFHHFKFEGNLRNNLRTSIST
jgi:hypothetical protein